jgi:decaprenyl-phosphate phosphoribosyltransferase
LIFAAPFAAGKLFGSHIFWQASEAFIAFSLVSSSCYIINDICDVEIDKLNEIKKHRPIASGAISKNSAILLSTASLLAGIFIASPLPAHFQWTLLTYFMITNFYSFGLKNQPVVEFMIVAFGFALRAIAGGAATQLPVTKWFLVVAGFGSLVIVVAKRIAESVNPLNTSKRMVLAEYPPNFLNLVLAVAMGVTLSSYSLWAFSLPQKHPYAQISLVPVCLGLFRYIWLVNKGAGEAPEELLLKDFYLLLCALATVGLLFVSVYKAGV